MIEVEHIHPVAQGGHALNWDNFLLSCKYCNTVKRSHNLSRTGYCWPDIDNTDLLFDYSETEVIIPKHGLQPNQVQAAENTIRLMGLNRTPGGAIEPTPADTRWIIRAQAWDKARKSLANWFRLPTPELAKQIGITALDGHYSIWREVFRNIPEVLEEIDTAYSDFGLFKTCHPNGVRVVRPNGII